MGQVQWPGAATARAWVDWGPRRFENVPAEFLTEVRGAGADHEKDGIIGTDLLKRFVVVFDPVGERIGYVEHAR